MEIKKVVTGDDLGKAIAVNPETNKVDTQIDGVTIKVNAQNQLYADIQSGGLDCAAIDELPIKPWKKDTVVLAKQDGECVRLKPNGDIFTDIVVNLAANKQNFEIGKNQSETVNLIATVTNAGTNPTGEVFVTLTKPQLGTYQVGTPTTNNIGEEKTGELTWKVPTMASGKALVITLPVTLSAVGSFSFGLQATSTIDTDTTNNTKTFTFAVTAKNDGTNTNYVPEGTACPLIVATDLTHNQRLNVYTTGVGGDYYKEFGKYINVFADGNGFAGKRIKLEGASTVVVTSTTFDGSAGERPDSSLSNYRNITSGSATEYVSISSCSGSNSRLSRDGVRYNYAGGRTGSCYSPSQGMVVAAGSFLHGAPWNKKTNASPVFLRDLGTFDPATKIFTFRSDLQLPTPTTTFEKAPYHCVIWCRPAGKDCRWQGIPIILGIKDKIPSVVQLVYSFNKIKGDVTAEQAEKIPSFAQIDPDFINAANFVGGEKPKDLISKNGAIGNNFVYKAGGSYTVTVNAGTEAQFTITAEGDENKLPTYISTGKTRTSYDSSKKMLTVTVAADATATDSVYWDDLKIIVK